MSTFFHSPRGICAFCSIQHQSTVALRKVSSVKDEDRGLAAAFHRQQASCSSLIISLSLSLSLFCLFPALFFRVLSGSFQTQAVRVARFQDRARTLHSLRLQHWFPQKTQLILQNWRPTLCEVKTEQSLSSAVKAEIPGRISALKSKSMKLLMATKAGREIKPGPLLHFHDPIPLTGWILSG